MRMWQEHRLETSHGWGGSLEREGGRQQPGSGGVAFWRRCISVWPFELVRKLVIAPHSARPARSQVSSTSTATPLGPSSLLDSNHSPRKGADPPFLLASGSQAILLKHR